MCGVGQAGADLGGGAMSGRYGKLAAWLALVAAFAATVVYRLAYGAPHPYPVTAGVLAAVVSLFGVLWALAEFITGDDDDEYAQEILRDMHRNWSKGDPT